MFKNPGEEVRFSVTVGGKSNLYQWYKNGEILSDAISEVFIIPSYSPSDTGIYSCRITNTLAIMLTLTSEPVTLQTSTSGVIESMNPRPSIAVWPNPVSYRAAVRYTLANDQQVTIQIIDHAGRIVEEMELGAQTRGEHLADWFTGTLEQGSYFLRLKNSQSVYKLMVIGR
ncbi:MAG: T9SS type A sorting domain-containing protein [Bacteroidia bacterium]|nr:T9SS type A sorting domain-containing protein [Bacteroidia bacterium]